MVSGMLASRGKCDYALQMFRHSGRRWPRGAATGPRSSAWRQPRWPAGADKVANSVEVSNYTSQATPGPEAGPRQVETKSCGESNAENGSCRTQRGGSEGHSCYYCRRPTATSGRSLCAPPSLPPLQLFMPGLPLRDKSHPARRLGRSAEQQVSPWQFPAKLVERRPCAPPAS